ncbi:MAG TPA: lipid-binding SYLF domain-containing protein [Syntrophorhabdaceae bacterium]|jgi:lipid-binding SYLF domain-containing protein
MKKGIYLHKIGRSLVVAALLFGFLLLPAFADSVKDSRQLVEKARMTFEDFVAAPEMEAFRDLLKNGRGVFIAPQILKGAFIVGAAGGSGIFLVKDAKTQEWVGPAFYTIGEASFGLQAGGQSSEVVLVAMTERGVTALLSSSVKLGADVGVAVGPIGAGAAASTANLSADIISFSRSKGLFGGISLDGAVVTVRDKLNGAYYGKKKVTPTDILIRRNVTSPRSTALLADVAKEAAKK